MSANAAPSRARPLPGWELDCLPRVVPVGWRIDEQRMDGARYAHDLLRLIVVVSAAVELDGRRWLHVSCSHAKRIPTWEEFRIAKDVFVGQDRLALQVLPRQRDYVNINPRVLHLWCCLDADVTPDFTRGTGSI